MLSRLTYRDQSRTYLKQAVEELERGDVRQASEKGWGAAAQMVKAVADRRGLRHNAHPLLHEAVSRLVEETGDDEFRTLFSAANLLHVNFYEGGFSAAIVEKAIQDVTRFVDKAERFIPER